MSSSTTRATSSASPATDVMMSKLLFRGMLIGILAGLVAFGFAQIHGEPQVAQAIALEGEGGHSHGAPAAPDPATSDHEHAPGTAAHDHGEAAGESGGEGISRGTQAGVGLLTGTTAYGMAIGGILALVFAGVQGRVSHLRPRATIALVALGGYVALVLVPGLKYPANPPAVGSGETIGIRTAMYFVMLGFSVAAMVLSVVLGRNLSARHGAWNATLYAAAAYLVLVSIVGFALPRLDEVTGSGFPAQLLWEFRASTFALQAVIWSVLAIGFGIAAERLLGQRRAAGI